MEKIRFIVIFLILFLVGNQLFAEGEAQDKTMRFYAGEILRAEIQKDNGKVQINNINEYEPPSKIKENVGYALVTVLPDSGRSLGIYDYSLVQGDDVFPCVALMDNNGDFDASLWEIEKIKSGRKYTMLFKVQLPPKGKPDYNLRFNLLNAKWRDLPVPFTYVKTKPFTDLKEVPVTGMLGVDPYKIEPKVEPTAPGKDKGDTAGKKGDDKGEKPGKKPEKKSDKEKPANKKLSDKEARQKADAEAWEALMGASKKDSSSKDSSSKKKKKNKKKKDSSKKGSWDNL